MDYCICELPIKMVRLTSENFKVWHCAKCEKPVDPKSKMLDKKIAKLEILPGDFEGINEIRKKINEIADILKANGLAE